MLQNQLNTEEIEILAKAYVNPDKNKQTNYKQMILDISNTDPNNREELANSLEKQKWINELVLWQNTKIPFLYILGKDDGFININAYNEFLINAGFQKNQIKILDGVRHVPQLDDPENTAKLISEFILHVVKL